MLEPIEDDEPRGRVDGVAVAYILGGIPAIVLFLVLIFGAVKLWNIPT